MRKAVFLAALSAAVAAGCSRDEAPAPGEPSTSTASTPAPGARAPAASGAPAAGGSAIGDDPAGIAAIVKLAGQEYALAVDDTGAIKDDTELAEAELFADQAKLKYQRLAPEVKAPPEAIAAARVAIDALVTGVTSRRPPAEVGDLARAAARAVSALGPAETATTAGIRAATAQADRAIEAEVPVGDYRIGVFVEPPRRWFRHAAGGAVEQVAPAPGAKTYVGVVLRERRTKRFLPDAALAVEVLNADGSVVARRPLEPLWGDFPQYGANLESPGIPSGKLRVVAEPPHHARHGDMLGKVAKPAQAEMDFSVVDGRVAIVPIAGLPADPDYQIGDDVLQGFAEARAVVDAGGYRLGFIAEAPEPIWLWQGAGPQLKAVRPDDTHHLEIVVQDVASGLLVPSGDVTLTLTPKAGGTPMVAPLHSLLSAFQHYGETLRVAPGDYRVRIDVKPPAIAVLDSPRFLAPAEAEVDWRAEAPAPADAAEPTG